MSSGCIISLS